MTVQQLPATSRSGRQAPCASGAPIADDGRAGSDEPVADEVLLGRIAGRDVSALDELYGRYGRIAFSVAYHIVGSAESAEDVVQEAFLTVWRRADSFVVGRGSARTWLLSVVRHRAIDLARSRASRPRGVPLEDFAVLAAPDGDPSDEAMRRIEGTTIRAALSGLPGSQRQVVELAYFSGLSYPEIADRIGVPLGTVKSRIRLATERLRGALAASGLGPAYLTD